MDKNIKLEKLEKKDRGVVREQKIPKGRNGKLEKAFIDAAKKERELDLKDHALREDREAKRILFNKIVSTGTSVEIQQERVKRGKEELQKYIQEEDDKILSYQNKIKEEQKKPDNKRRAVTIQTQTMLINRANGKIGVYGEAEAKLNVQEAELKVSHEELSLKVQSAQSDYDEVDKLIKENKKELKKVRDDIVQMAQEGEKFADDDYKEALKTIEKITKQLKYKKFVPIGQSVDSWTFLLLEPEEYEGSVISVKVDEKVDEVIK